MSGTPFRTRAIVSVALLAFAVTLTSVTQQPPRPVPGPEMERLKFMVGEWTYEEKYEPGPFGPGGSGSGTMTARLGPGGFSIIIDFRGKNPMGEVEGHEIQTWDPGKNAYVTYAVGSEFPGALSSTGQWEGDTLVYNGSLASPGGRMNFRAKTTVTGEKSVRYTVEFGIADQPLALMLTGRATKK